MMPLLPPHVRNRFDYPSCCGEATGLRHHGWVCMQCRTVLPFRDGEGRTWQEQQPAQNQTRREKKRKTTRGSGRK